MEHSAVRRRAMQWRRVRTSILLVASVALIVTWGLVNAEPASAGTCVIDGTAVTTVASQAECDALVALYTSTDGSNWNVNTGWNTPTDPCGWYGVTCDAGVTDVDLFANSLSGSIPAEIGGLSNIALLGFQHSQLTSLPPEIGDLVTLEFLGLDSNLLSSLPPEIGGLSNLTLLGLSNNQLSSVPSEIGSLSGLEQLWLSGNQLSSVPPEIGDLSGLQWLSLSGNLLSGDITLPMSGVQDTLSMLSLSDGPGQNSCLTVTDSGLGSWLTSMDPGWDECDVVVVVGGPSVVSDEVLTELQALVSGSVTRVWGANRYATAAAISEANFEPGNGFHPTVFIATGENFPDALAAGPAAGLWEAPILLVRQNAVPRETVAELARLEPGRIVVVGGPAAVSDGVVSKLEGFASLSVTRVWGATRYGTAAAVSASTFAPGVSTVYVATGENFPDALAGGPAGVINDGPILLVRQDAVPNETAAELARLAPSRIVVLGGGAAVSDGVVAELGSMASSGVSRYWGANRYGTAVALSEAVFPSGARMVFITTGENFPDAVAAGPVAGMLNAPILLVTATAVPSSTASEVVRLGP